jgi:hypothetical protein
MKSLMSIPTLLTVIVVAGEIALIPLSQPPLPISAYSDSDESETNAEQRVREKNLGSGESNDFNCDENMITSASGVDCIPSGPAPPTPPPQAQPFTISGGGSGTVTCLGTTDPATIVISAQGEGDGSATGAVNFFLTTGGGGMSVTGGTTDGNTFSLSGETSPFVPCGSEVQQYTVSGGCGNNVMISYEEPDMTGTFTGDVTCTLL